jgi:hypothetical protein
MQLRPWTTHPLLEHNPCTSLNTTHHLLTWTQPITYLLEHNPCNYALEQPTHSLSTTPAHPWTQPITYLLEHNPCNYAPWTTHPLLEHNLRTRSASITFRFPPKHTNRTPLVPPPQYTYVDPRAKSKKRVNPNSPNNILFVIQRKISKFPQNIVLHLVTLFSVCLRVLPFFEHSPKKFQTSNLFKPRSTDPIIGSFSPSLIRGPRPVLIIGSGVLM